MAFDRTDHTLKLVSMAYRVAVEPESFDDLLGAWDGWVDEMIAFADAPFEDISPIFQNALAVVDRLDEAEDAKLMPALELAPAPAVLFDEADRVLAMNAAASAFLKRDGAGAAQFLTLTPAAMSDDNLEGAGVYRLGGGASGRSFLAMEARLSPRVLRDYPDAARLIMLSRVDWNAAFGAELAARLNLSPAELRVARTLLEGLTAQEMAQEMNRSLPTIRSHIKALLRKTGTRRQQELVQMLTILRVIGDINETSTEARQASGDFNVVKLPGPGGDLPVVEYGAGDPMLYFTSSSRPEETQPVRDALAAAGFRIIAPYRPGYADAPSVPCDANEALLDGWLDGLLAPCEAPPLIVGHREGGVIAAIAARRLAESGRPFQGLACISTGAPVTHWRAWFAAPPTIRRSFLAACVAPSALQLGYATAVRLFQSGEAGRDKIVRYFFADSPTDARKLTERYYYGITEAWIDHSFNNVPQVVRDIALWASGWSSDLQQVAERVPVLMVHGAQHSFFPVAGIQALEESITGVSSLILEDSAQLALYEHPGRIAQGLRDTVERAHGRNHQS